ncbi:MAG TPA: tail fiber domain-containing protein [Chthoniobacterales bacterium]|jgi:hypothetical protein
MKTSRAFAVGLLAALVLPSFALAIDPPPGGGYPNDITALGTDALFSLGTTYPSDNTAIGFSALYSDVVPGATNTAVGSYAMYDNTTGNGNVALGFDAMYGNTIGHGNVALGVAALVANTTGVLNVAIGFNALSGPAAGSDNVAIGNQVMSNGATGTYNTAVGNAAMAFSAGSENVAVGDGALNQSSGSQNIGIGQAACLTTAGSNNIGIGEFAGENVTTGTNNFMVGQNAGQNITTGSNNIDIDNLGTKKDSGVIRVGDASTQKKTFVAGISGVTISNGIAVVVSKQGQLGVATSSAHFKDNIQPMKDASDVLLSLQPVTFRYKKELDSLGTPQFGLVAEQVAKVDPDLVARDESGQPYTVRYEAVNAMLLNEFLKEHRKVEHLEATVSELKTASARAASLETTVGELKAALKQQAAQIQKVSAEEQNRRAASRLISAND